MNMKLWVARDAYGDIYLYRTKPYQKTIRSWTCSNQEYFWLDDESFPEVTFENSPQEVEIKLVEK